MIRTALATLAQAAAITALLAAPASAQDALSPFPETEPFDAAALVDVFAAADILGMQIGQPRDEVREVLRARAGDGQYDFREDTTNVGIADNRGNQVGHSYLARSDMRNSSADGAYEEITAAYTSEATGARLKRLDRTLGFAASSPGEMTPFRAALIDKYGEPSTTGMDERRGGEMLYWVWKDGAKQSFDYPDFTDLSRQNSDIYSGFDPVPENPDPAFCIWNAPSLSAYVFSDERAQISTGAAEPLRNEVLFDGCQLVLTARLVGEAPYLHNAELTLASLPIAEHDTAAIDRYLLAEMDKLQNNQSTTAVPDL